MQCTIICLHVKIDINECEINKINLTLWRHAWIQSLKSLNENE